MNILKKLSLNRKKDKPTLVAPFLGSALGSSKKEAMAAILIEVVKIKGKKLGEKIFVSEFNEIVKKMKAEDSLPTVYDIFFSGCWNACYEMANEGLLITHQKEGGVPEDKAYIIITEELFKILELDIPN